MEHLRKLVAPKSSKGTQQAVGRDSMFNALDRMRFDPREMKKVQAGDKKLRFSFSKTVLDFNGESIPVGKQGEDTLDITNISDSPHYFRAVAPSSRPAAYDVSIVPPIMQLCPNETIALSIRITFHSTSSLICELPFVDPGVGWVPLAINAQSELGRCIDIEELKNVSRAHNTVNSKVFKALFRGKDVALKCFNEHFDETVRSDLQKELALWESLQNDFIAHFFGIVDTPDTFGVVFEWSPLGSLHDFLGKLQAEKPPQQLSPYVMQGLMCDIASGMALLHGKSIIHCNLASEHVLVFPFPEGDKRKFVAKLSDFGRARQVGESRVRTLGKGLRPPCYVAPELMDNEAYSRPSDVFSYAMISWEIVTQQRPYSGFEPSRVIRFVMEGARLPIPDTVPRSLAQIIELCWMHEPLNRPPFSSILKMLDEALKQIQQISTIQSTHPSPINANISDPSSTTVIIQQPSTSSSTISTTIPLTNNNNNNNNQQQQQPKRQGTPFEGHEEPQIVVVSQKQPQ